MVDSIPESMRQNVSIKSVNYKIDREKTIIKKMEAVKRTDPISVKYCTQGGKNIVMYRQAGLYELLQKPP